MSLEEQPVFIVVPPDMSVIQSPVMSFLDRSTEFTVRKTGAVVVYPLGRYTEFVFIIHKE